MKEFWTSLASLLGVQAFFQSLLQTVSPPELRFAFVKFLNRALNCFASYCYYDNAEIDGVNTNELYNAVRLYFGSFVSASGSRLPLTRAVNSSATTLGLSNNDCINDVFDGIAVQWEHVVMQRRSHTFLWRPIPDDKRGFPLRIRKRDKDLILDPYLLGLADIALVMSALRRNLKRNKPVLSKYPEEDPKSPSSSFLESTATVRSLGSSPLLKLHPRAAFVSLSHSRDAQRAQRLTNPRPSSLCNWNLSGLMGSRGREDSAPCF